MITNTDINTEEKYITELNNKPGLLDLDPLNPAHRKELHGTYETKHYLQDIFVPENRMKGIVLRIIDQKIYLEITQANLLAVLESFRKKNSTWLHKMAPALIKHFEESTRTDWHNIILNYKLDRDQEFDSFMAAHGIKTAGNFSREESREYYTSPSELKNIEKTRIDIILEVITTGITQNCLSIFDAERQHYVRQISYQGHGFLAGPLAGSGGVTYSYLGKEIVYLQQWMS